MVMVMMMMMLTATAMIKSMLKLWVYLFRHLRVRLRIRDDRVALRFTAGSGRRRHADRGKHRPGRFSESAVVADRAAVGRGPRALSRQPRHPLPDRKAAAPKRS